jgi:hypothetical protein
MQFTTSGEGTETLYYGFSITPTTHVYAVEPQLNVELRLSPGVTYFIPWPRESMQFIPAGEHETTGVPAMAERHMGFDEDSRLWLKLAESAFRFWHNEADEIWSDL